MRWPALTGALIALLATACGTAAPTPTPPTPQPTPTPTPAPDLNQRVDVGATGVGVYQLVTVPVATLHNASTQHAALGVVVHFTPRAGGRALDAVDSPPIDIPPGATIVVTANCTDTCGGANHTDVAVNVTNWGDPIKAPVITVSGAAFHKGGGGAAGFGQVSGTMSAMSVPSGAPVTAFAACSVGGVIIGGGYTQDAWVSAGSPQQVSVSVILSTNPDHCDLYAAIGG